jgi:hypothetical protein
VFGSSRLEPEQQDEHETYAEYHPEEFVYTPDPSGKHNPCLLI